MKINYKLAIIPMLMMSPVLLAAQSVDKKITTESNPKLNLQVHRGDVQITPWENNEIQVTGTLDELSEGLIVEKKGNIISIEDKMPRRYSGNNKDGSKLTIMVPRELNLSAEGVSTSYHVNDLNGDINIQSVSGNIKATNLANEVTIYTVSGDIQSNTSKGKLSLETVSGNIKDNQSIGNVSYKLVSGQLTANSKADEVAIEIVSGDANLTLEDISHIKSQSVSGDVTLSMQSITSKASLSSVSGDINLTLPDNSDASFEIDGGPGGKIQNSLTDDKPYKQKYSPNSTLNFQLSNGNADIKMSTISGSVRLKKSS
ncbi:DUF4097 domain-containing protein [Shewanella mesophila]|uniref:DUF4097 family beta strand repeat-containing protein n=1 Tax=Shewanella mesophila TaxID=2864208 RepID=UPI001C655D5B|nr:DUF4097 family beta strand repeat-containing protein [Shewanella mesophila]QYJ87019.1 DUF4097 domain-containing protein [Shewanella mesophila]